MQRAESRSGEEVEDRSTRSGFNNMTRSPPPDQRRRTGGRQGKGRANKEANREEYVVCFVSQYVELKRHRKCCSVVSSGAAAVVNRGTWKGGTGGHTMIYAGEQQQQLITRTGNANEQTSTGA